MAKKLQDVLPKGISAETVAEITKLVESTIEQRVAKEVKELSTKVLGFLKLKQDEIQESALKQLEETNETYRNARLFEHIRGLMAVEVASEDYDLPLSNLVEENKKLEESLDTLSNELSEALQENAKLVNSVKLLEEKITKVETLAESKKQPFKSSEKAIMPQAKQEKTKSERIFEDIEKTGNSLLSEDILRLAGVKNDVQ